MVESQPFNLLTPGIRTAYQSATARRQTEKGVQLLAARRASNDDQEFGVGAALFEADLESFLRNPELAAEVFGPATLVVRHSTREQMLELARNLGGHLTATIHGTEADLREFSDLLEILKTKVGRLVFNGFPTGVEVSHAMVHGGPYPSTSDGRSTSVGSGAIFRFCRPVCYQGFPESALPDELRDGEPPGYLANAGRKNDQGSAARLRQSRLRSLVISPGSRMRREPHGRTDRWESGKSAHFGF